MTHPSLSGQAHYIQRFRLLRALGQGAQGVVYEAHDPRLNRHVAIKTLALGEDATPAKALQLIDSAKTASRLTHPNIVPVFETGLHDGQPFVVFEYIEGTTLAELLQTGGALPADRAVILMSQILAGIAHVHASGFLHGDIKPANILVGQDGIPRVTDFGISRLARIAADEVTCSGTVQYMSPECVSKGHADYRSDVFALGLLFHEMLTGTPVFCAANDYAQMYSILNESVSAPSASRPGIDPRIDAIVLKAVEHDPCKRYADAGEMKTDLDRFRVPRRSELEAEQTQEPTHSTVSYLLRRMALKSDFPALSASFTRINQLTSQAGEAPMQAIADLVIRDFALTQKILRVVNSAEFAMGKVSRVSQAISLLGVSRLRSLIIGMSLAGSRRSGPGCPAVAAALADFFVAGVISRNIGRMLGLKTAEELFICGMFSRLGQLLTLYYLKDEYEAIQRHIADEGSDPLAASHAVLGLSFDELGIAVARHWHFPETITRAMRSLPAGEVVPVKDDVDRMQQCAAYARELCALARIENDQDREAAFAVHQARFSLAVPVDPERVRDLLAHSMTAVVKYVAAAELPMSQTTLLDGLRALAGRAGADSPDSADAASTAPQTGAPAPTTLDEPLSMSFRLAVPMPGTLKAPGLRMSGHAGTYAQSA